jgi:hydroxymethylpyrimidine pyrophosphatase-like HAD family hydrolase
LSTKLVRSEESKRIRVLVFDYDGTLTLEDGELPPSTEEVLKEVYERKLALLGIVSGREMAFLKNVDTKLDHVFSFLVAENGAVLYFSDAGHLSIVGKEWSEKVRKIFSKANFPIQFWEIIGSTRRENTDKVENLLKVSNIEAKLAPNKNSVMICPPNVDKGIGVASAVAHYGETSDVLLTCFGDGENDVSLFGPADVRVAVSNAVSQLKKIADVVTEQEGGFGVEEYLRKTLLSSPVAREPARL